MNADPAVMRYFPALMSAEESIAAATRYNEQLDRDGFTMFAAESLADGTLLGVLGAQTMRFPVPGLPQPAVEIGWRLATSAQGHGLATEGARALLAFLRANTTLQQVVAITAPENLASRNVMEKLHMQLRPELSFDHPNVAEGCLHRQHVLYSLELHA